MKNFLKFKTGENNQDHRKFGEEFYLREAKLWRPFRLCGVFAISLALPLTLTSIFNNNWVYGDDFNAGIWNCKQVMMNGSGPCQDLQNDDDGGLFRNWQNAVIGLMIFSASFGLVAAILAIIGVCTSPLPKKIYYFHSAGEIFLVCAISVGVALVIYPAALEMDKTVTSKHYGAGYGLGWGGAFSFLLAALCMSLDEFVREASKTRCCRVFFMSRQSERSELQPV